MPGWKEALLGKSEQLQQIPRFTPEQQSAMNQLLSFSMPQLTSGQFDFGPIEQKARTGFEQKTIPSIAERFTSMGQGSQGSSAFTQQLGAAGAGLEESLAGLGADYGLKQQSLLQNLLGMGLGQRSDTMLRPETSGFLGNLFGAGAQGIGGLLPLLLKGLL